MLKDYAIEDWFEYDHFLLPPPLDFLAFGFLLFPLTVLVYFFHFHHAFF